MIVQTFFWLLAAAAVLTALGLLRARHPIAGAVNLIGLLLSLAGIYSLLAAPTLAVVQVLVYTGAIMMLVIFVIMVLGSARDTELPRMDGLSAVGLLLGAAVPVVLITALSRAGLADAKPMVGAPQGTIEALGDLLFSFGPGGMGYWLVFLLASLVLLAAMVAAVLLAKRRLDTPEDAPVVEDAHGHA